MLKTVLEHLVIWKPSFSRSSHRTWIKSWGWGNRYALFLDRRQIRLRPGVIFGGFWWQLRSLLTDSLTVVHPWLLFLIISELVIWTYTRLSDLVISFGNIHVLALLFLRLGLRVIDSRSQRRYLVLQPFYTVVQLGYVSIFVLGFVNYVRVRWRCLFTKWVCERLWHFRVLLGYIQFFLLLLLELLLKLFHYLGLLRILLLQFIRRRWLVFQLWGCTLSFWKLMDELVLNHFELVFDSELEVFKLPHLWFRRVIAIIWV